MAGLKKGVKNEVAVFGGGCFWCTEAVFKMLKGVKSVLPGYAGGETTKPNYEEVSTGKSGHAEVVRIEYGPAEIDFDDLLTVFFATHDPTSLNRQGSDVGTQYRSAVFFTTDEQRKKAEAYVKSIEGAVTEVESLDKFYEAESYNHDYYELNKDKPYCQVVIKPKLKKLKEKFSELLKRDSSADASA